MSKRYWLLAILCFCLIICTVNGATLMPDFQASTSQTAPSPSTDNPTMKAQSDKSDALFPFDEYGINSRSGYIDRTGREVIKLRNSYSSPRPFSEGLAAVTVWERAKDGELRQKLGYIDKTGQLVIKPEFYDSDNDESEEAETFSEGLAAVAIDKNGSYRHGYIDKTGKVVIPFQYDEVHPFSQGLALVTTPTEGKWPFAFINKKGEKVFEHPQLNSAESFSEGLAAVSIGSKWGYIGINGKVVIEPQFAWANSFSEGLAAVTVQTDSGELKVGYIERTGKFVIKPQFSSVSPFAEGLAAVQVGGLKGKWGYIDRTGKFVIQPQFEDLLLQAGQFSEGLATVLTPTPKESAFGLTGFIDKSGNFVIKPQFSLAEAFSEGLAKVDIFPYTESGEISTNDPKQA